MSSILDVDTIVFTVLGYPMSFVELSGTILYLWSVWLMARRSMLTWPVGIVAVLLYMALFYQIRLYSDAVEQVYYLGASGYGWWRWKSGLREGGTEVRVAFSTPRSMAIVGACTLIASGLTGTLMERVHLLLPSVFPEPASYPYVDALTTVMSFTAMWLLALKRTESWIYWIVVNVIGTWLYFVKEVRFVSLLYVILLGLAVSGLMQWRRSAAEEGAA
jgi:nicotinamide mononucleotide transporter